MTGFTAFVHEITEQVHNDIKQAVEEGGLPQGASESVDTHKTLVCMHVLNCIRSQADYKGEVNYNAIEQVVERQINNIINE